MMAARKDLAEELELVERDAGGLRILRPIDPDRFAQLRLRD
jgi:hypothetical protein